MKCIKRVSEVRRVDNSLADKMVRSEGWAFCSKTEWKNLNRKPSEPKTETEKPEKPEKTPRKKGKASFKVSHRKTKESNEEKHANT